MMKSFLVGGTEVVYYLNPCSQALDYFQWYFVCKHEQGSNPPKAQFQAPYPNPPVFH